MDTLWQDVRYGFRMLLKSRGVTLVAVLTLALGIGANTAIFSVIDSVLLRPLPYPDADRVVWVSRVQPPITRGPISQPDYFVWQAEQKVFSSMGAFYWQDYVLTGIDQAEALHGVRVTPEFFGIFGLRPLCGRFMTAGDEQAGAPRVVVIGETLWKNRFGGEVSALGKTLTLNGEDYTVIGVAPRTVFPTTNDVWVPTSLPAEKKERGSNYLKVLARLGDGVTRERAEAQMNQITAALATQFPDNDAKLSVNVTPMLEETVRGVRGALYILFGAVGLVLLIACANVANILLSRAAGRRKEFAIRAALGAPWWRVARQVLTESVLLAGCGGALGVLLALGATVALRKGGTGIVPRIGGLSVDRDVLLFTLAVSLLTGVVFGVIPALQSTRLDANESLREGTRGAGTFGPRGAAANRLLVVTEMALSLALLMGAGLLIRSLDRVMRVDPGFDPEPLLTADVTFPRSALPAGLGGEERYERQVSDADRFLRAVERRIEALPGVEAVGAINDLPVTGASSVNGDFNVAGRPKFPPGQAPVAEFRVVTPGYLRAMGLPLKRGRFFTEEDGAQRPGLVVINETLAERYFPGADPVGQRLEIWDGKPHEIAGVIGDARQWGLDAPPSAEVYFSASQFLANESTALVVRTGRDPASLANAVRAAVAEASRDAPIRRVLPMAQVVADSTNERRFQAALMGLFAGMALAMAAIGLYAVMSHSVAQRVREIGIRIALGAARPDVYRLIVGQGMRLAAAGIAAGLVLSAASVSLVQSLLFGVSPWDPATFALMAALLSGIALFACWVPARRATRVDPLVSLRSE